MITTCLGVVAEKLLPMLDKFEKIDLPQFCLESSENLDSLMIFWENTVWLNLSIAEDNFGDNPLYVYRCF